MKNKKLDMYTLVAIYAVIIHIIATFYFFLSTEMTLFVAILLVLIIPVIFIPIYGIGRIISLLESSVEYDELYDDITYYSQDINDEDIIDDLENKQIEIEETKTTSDNNNSSDISQNEEENLKEDKENAIDYNEKFTPEIKKNKIRCVYCGTFNNLKKEHCFLCGKKLKK